MITNNSIGMTLPQQISNISDRLKEIEERFSDLGYDTKSLVTSEVRKKWKVEAQATSMFGVSTALCVDTADPWKQNRVRYYSPMLFRPNSPIKELPWAEAISSFGGFDGSGASWVPPAGSTICLLFEQGFRNAPFYIGTTWTRDRGPEGKRNFNYNIEEFYAIHEGNRKGYLVGPNDESQVLPPWNTESYNGDDLDNTTQFNKEIQSQKKSTYPNIYGIRTNENHAIKFVDGDAKCNKRWKRFEFFSSCGNWIIMKDDHLHPSGQWAHPSCGKGGDVSDCKNDPDKNCDNPKQKSKFSNPYYKYTNECRPYKGPGTPQNNKAELDQTGIQMLTISGQSLIMDDSVDQPRGKPDRERANKSFDYGCNNIYKGKFVLKSSTGHEIKMDDDEQDTNLRSSSNGIRLKTASGISIELNDHTVRKTGEGGNFVAGEKRGVKIESSSKHIFHMCDEENEQKSPDRKEGGTPAAKAKKAFVRLRSGGGLQFMMNDRSSQEETDKQFIEIWAPQKDNTERGSHIIKMQETKTGPGLIFLRAGGNYVLNTYDNMIDITGSEKNPSNKFSLVSQNYIVDVKKLYFNHAENHFFLSEDKIFLAAGRDCENPDTKEASPCLYNVVINRCPTPCPLFPHMLHFTPGKSTSERVFVSGSNGKEACG